MKALLFPVASVLAVCAPASAQPQPAPEEQAFDRPNRIYAELLGNAGGGSVNYEREIVPRVTARVGFGYMPGLPETTVNAVAAPIMVSLTPRGRRGVELGVGLVLRHQTGGRRVYQDGRYVNQSAQFTDTFLTATVGYRWITERGTVLRVGLTPLYGRPEGNDNISGGVPLIGVSVGKAF